MREACAALVDRFHVVSVFFASAPLFMSCLASSSAAREPYSAVPAAESVLAGDGLAALLALVAVPAGPAGGAADAASLGASTALRVVRRGSLLGDGGGRGLLRPAAPPGGDDERHEANQAARGALSHKRTDESGRQRFHPMLKTRPRMNRPKLVALAVSVFSVSCAQDRVPPRVAQPTAAPPDASAQVSSSALWEPPSSKGTTTGAYSGHGVQSVLPEVIARYAPTPLPADVSRRIQAMLDVRAPGGGRVSPDGKTLFFNWSVTGVLQVWKLDGPRRFPVQLTGGEDVTRLLAITHDGKWLVVARDRKGEENPGVYLLDPNGGPLKLVQHKPNVQTRFHFVSDDSKYLYYSANDIKQDAYAIYRYDIAADKREALFTEDGLWAIGDHTKDKLLLSKATGALTSEWYELDLASKKLTPVIGMGEKEEYDLEYSGAPGELVVRTNKLGEFRRLYKLKGGQLAPISPDVKMDVEAYSLDDAKKHILFTYNDGGYTRLRALDGKTYAELKLPEFKEADHVFFGASSHDGRYTTIAVESAKSPTRTYIYDWITKQTTEWVVPSSPEIDTRTFAIAKVESYPARDGTQIPVIVRRPDKCDPRPCPVLVLFHGGPEGQARPGFSPTAQAYVDAGFVLVEPNVRGSDGYGKSWLHADDGPRRLAIITDIEDAAKWARKAFAEGGKEPKVGVFGGSYGGYSTLVAMTMFAGAYDAGVSIVGISNLLTFLQNTAPYRRALRISEYGDPEKDRDALVKLSPVTYVDKVSAPLMLIQGATDPRVPVGEAVQLHDALERRGNTTKLIIFPDEGHGAQKRENRVLQIGHTLDFFERHLKEKK
jgi:dipeptidyl aminopeptidase/acylaminoacyl peptidase